MSIDILRNLVIQHQDELSNWQANSDEVTGKYGKIFHPDNLNKLTADIFHSFLLSIPSPNSP